MSLELVSDLCVSSGHPSVSSLKVAERFGKQHKHVLDSIRKLCNDLPADFTEPNFRQCFKINELANNKKEPYYDLTRDGFTMLAMGFTGKEAALWKVRYIQAFNAMEAELLNRATTTVHDGRISTVRDREPLRKLCGVWARTAKLHFPDCYTQVAGQFNLDSITQIPAAWIPDALDFVQHRIDEAQRITMEIAARADVEQLPPAQASDSTAPDIIMSMLRGIAAQGAQFPQAEKPTPKPPTPSGMSVHDWLCQVAPAIESIVQTLAGLGATREQIMTSVDALVHAMTAVFVDARLAFRASHPRSGSAVG